MRKYAAAPWLAPLALLAVVLGGCGGPSSRSAAPAGSPSSPVSSASSGSAAGSTPAPGFASTSAGTPSGVLSKPDFLIKMNALCSAVDAQRQALPTPTGATDFAAISVNITGTMRLLPSLISHAEALIAQTAQRAELEKNWLAVERADYAATKPIAERMVADSNARDAAKVQADADAMSAAPNHSSSLMAYLNDFGLSSCAHLESQ
ncbi:MAG: hypothetical protein QOI26_1259 [Pseudonocardiales bacterium]|nr:hypothetical protein [Pseudonocardiales bacterium]